jgi:hypothetical protein
MSLVRKSAVNAAIVAVIAGLSLGAANAATVSQSVTVEGSPSKVWAMIGPFCSIQHWLPPVGTCKQDHDQYPTRTLVTKDGSATFVERLVDRDDFKHFYSYTFVSSPLPVTNYTSTIWVTSIGHGQSSVTWRGTYTPLPGQESAAREALDGIYAAGLDSIRAKTLQRVARVAQVAP